MKNRHLTCVVLMMLCFGAMPQTLVAQQKTGSRPGADLGAFVKEIMEVKLDDTGSQLALWFPYEFFIEAALAQPGATRASAEKDLAFLKPYITIIIQCQSDQLDGTSSYASEKEVRARAALKLADGTEVYPLDKVPPMITALVSAMKTLITSEGDAGSANMHILVFPSQSKQGKPIIDTSRKDKLTLALKNYKSYGEAVFTWRTPFDATAKITMCARCKERISAKWSYCPWCGQKISKD